MSESIVSVDHVEGHGVCTACHGAMEPELVAIYPAMEVCLDCMAPQQKERLQDELNQVQKLDRASLPALPRVPGWDIGLHYRPSRLLSGDFYDVRRDRETASLTFLLGDVQGKGIPAALLRTGLLGSLRALSALGSPAKTLEKTNEHFLEMASPGRLATVFCGVLDAARGEIRYANAGHLPPLVRSARGEWRSLDTTGMVLGAMADVPYAEKRMRLESGDLMVLYSDGITEAENESGIFFDETRLMALVNALSEEPVQQIASSVAEELERFAPGEPGDDRTLVVVRRS